MELFNSNNITINISEGTIDFELYANAVNFFQASGFYMKSNYILPYKFIDGSVHLDVSGEAGVNYSLTVGDLKWDFLTSMSIALPMENIAGNVVDITVRVGNSTLGGVSIAFTHYMVFVYVFIYMLGELFQTLDQYSFSKFIIDNDRYPSILENHFGKLAGFSRETIWASDEYREKLAQWVDSFSKYPAMKKGIIQLLGVLGYQGFIQSKAESWVFIPGYNLMPTPDKWVIEEDL